MSINLRIERTPPQTVAVNANVLFNNVPLLDGSIDYDSATGVITINQAGTFIINWTVSAEATLSISGTVFSLITSSGENITNNNCRKTGEASGFGIINVPAPGVTVRLVNTSLDSIVLQPLVPIKASLMLFEEVPGATGPTGPTGATGPQGAAVITEFASYYLNSSRRYVEGDLMYFSHILTESGISIDPTGTKITLGSKSYYKLSYGVNIFSVDRGAPLLQLLMNGSPLASPTGLNMTRTGFSSLDLVYLLEPNAEISFRIVRGDITLDPNYYGITEYITIMSIQ